MDKLFVETKYIGALDLPSDLIKALPDVVMISTTIQYIDFLQEIKHRLSLYGKEVHFFNSLHGKFLGQMLGCDNFKVKRQVDAFLYIGDGEFHPRALLVNEKPVFVFNPLSDRWKRLD